MKKLLIALFAGALIAASSVEVKAQSTTVQIFDMKSSYGLTKDTVINTGTNTIQLSYPGSFKYMTIQPVVTKISGTITSNSTPQLQGSVDGTNWVNITGDTLHCTNQTTNSTVWKLDNTVLNYYYYLRITYTGVGTMVATLKAKVLFRKPE